MHLSVNLSYNLQLFLYSKQDTQKLFSIYIHIEIVRPCEISLALHSEKANTFHFIIQHILYAKIEKYQSMVNK